MLPANKQPYAGSLHAAHGVAGGPAARWTIVPKNSRVLLISPFPDSGLTDMKEPPHGLAYIASALRERGYPVAVIDAKCRGLRTGQVVEEALTRRPDLVGITAMTPDIVWAAKIAAGIKAALPDVLIAVGGPHSTALPEETLREFPAFDVAAFGEGEETMLEIAGRLESGLEDALDGIAGIAYRKDGTVIVNPGREFATDLDAIPFPAWDLFSFPEGSAYPIYATRGCPFKCKFCQRVLGDRVRKRSVENVVKEIEWVLGTFGARGFYFADETFGADRAWTRELLHRMIERGIPSTTTWYAQTRADIIEEELLTLMKRAGCDGIAFGVESGSQEILRKTGKRLNLGDVRRAVALAKKLDIRTRSFFILGHPYETLQTIDETIRFAAELNTDFVSFAVMVPYPGTEIWRLARNGEAGYNYVSANWDDYRKHLATPLGFESIPPEKLKNLDKKAYLTFYIHNHRWSDLLVFLWGHRQSIQSYLQNKVRRLQRV